MIETFFSLLLLLLFFCVSFIYFSSRCRYNDITAEQHVHNQYIVSNTLNVVIY